MFISVEVNLWYGRWKSAHVSSIYDEFWWVIVRSIDYLAMKCMCNSFKNVFIAPSPRIDEEIRA